MALVQWLSAQMSYSHYVVFIRIYHECEGMIEKYVQRITVWHHEACRVLTNGDPEGQVFFYTTLTQIMDFFFLLTTVFFFFFFFFK